MKRLVFVYSAAVLALVGLYAVTLDPIPESPAQAEIAIETPAETVIVLEPENMSEVVFPIDGYELRDTFKNFGEFIDDRFHGYHMGDDIEFGDTSERIPVYAIADGTVLEHKEFVSGYGGFILTRHEIGGKTITALYGHLDTKLVPLNVGDTVKKGQVIAYLGEHETHETDGRRKHLHFGLYEGDEIRYLGYEKDAENVATWINPHDFFDAQGLFDQPESRRFKSPLEPGSEFERLSFIVPTGMEVEYDPETRALNIFRHAGVGTARDRAQIIIRTSDSLKFDFEKRPNLDSDAYQSFLASVQVAN